MTGIYYDAQGVQTVAHPERGVARFVREHALAIGQVAPGLLRGIVFDRDLPRGAALDELEQVAPLVPNDAPELTGAALFHVGSPFELGRAGAALVPYPVRQAGARLVATLYDLIPLALREEYLPTGIARALYRRSLELVRSCDAALAISQATADDARRLLGLPARQVTVIGAGADEKFRPPTVAPDVVARDLRRDVAGLEPGFILLPVGMDPRKNWARSMAAYADLDVELRARHQLILACRVDAEQSAAVRALTDQLCISDRVLVTGVVPDDVLVRLYQAAQVVLFPSRYEGFGLPPLEARQCGAPVICGDNSSLREVVVDPAARFDADDTDAIASTLRRALLDEGWRTALAAGPIPDFTWRRAAERTVPVYRRLAAGGRRNGRGWVGVLPTPGVALPVDVIDAAPRDVVVFEHLTGPPAYGDRLVQSPAAVPASLASGSLRCLAVVVTDGERSTTGPAVDAIDPRITRRVPLSQLAGWLADVDRDRVATA